MPYSERYVAYLDILGFSEIVKRSETDPRVYDALVKTLSEILAREGIKGEGAVDFQFQSFSDSIVLSSARSTIGLAYLLTAIVKFALELMQDELLIRGGIAEGKLYHEKGVMFGPAFIEAYHIEKTLAKYPRVILSKQTYEDFKASEPKLQQLIIKLSEDGPPCLHIFQFLKVSLNREDTRIEAIEIARKCRIAIQKLIDDSIYDPSHYEKLLWMALEWNRTIPGTLPGIESRAQSAQPKLAALRQS